MHSSHTIDARESTQSNAISFVSTSRTKLEHARVSASDQRSLQQPVNELSLAVQRTAQRDRPLFNLLVQKTELKAVRHTRPRQAPPTHPKPKPPTQSAQDAQHFRCPPTPPTAAVAAPTPAQRRPPTRPRGGRGSPPSSTASPPGRQNSNESMDFIVQRENMWYVVDTYSEDDLKGCTQQHESIIQSPLYPC